MVLAAFPLDLPTVGLILGFAVTAAGAGAIFVVKGMRGALEASQESVKTLLEARKIAKEALEDERARWELKVDALEVKIKGLEEQVVALHGQIVMDLLVAAKEALSVEAKAAAKLHRAARSGRR